MHRGHDLRLISKDTLHRVMHNDENLTVIRIGNTDGEGAFVSTNDGEFSILGTAIAKNTHLLSLDILFLNSNREEVLDISSQEFFHGLRCNTSIHELSFGSNGNHHNVIIGDLGQKILKTYQENCSSITSFAIESINIGNDWGLIVATVKSCNNLAHISLRQCSISKNMIPPLIQTIQVHNKLERLFLSENQIGNSGCRAIAQLLCDPGNNLQALGLPFNGIGNKGAGELFSNLSNNTKLRELHLFGNNRVDRNIEDIVSKILCNTSCIGRTHSSNHTLETVTFPYETSNHLSTLLELNEGTNKNQVAIKKIIRSHPSIELEPFFQFGLDGERNLKGLPNIISWFGSALQTAANNAEECDVKNRKLSAIYQFARTMPIYFEPSELALLYWKVNSENRNLKAKLAVLHSKLSA